MPVSKWDQIWIKIREDSDRLDLKLFNISIARGYIHSFKLLLLFFNIHIINALRLSQYWAVPATSSKQLGR